MCVAFLERNLTFVLWVGDILAVNSAIHQRKVKLFDPSWMQPQTDHQPRG